MINKSDSKFVLEFPSTEPEKIVETALMREVIKRTLAVHPGNTLWYGQSRNGKTTTARYMVQIIDEAYDDNNPDAFRAIHYEVGEIAAWSGNEQKKGLKSLHNATLGRIDEGIYRSDPAETIVENIVYGLMRKNIRFVLIDEAGNLSLDAIRGILMAYDYAKKMNHPLSFVFIGMDDLPIKVTNLPQVNGRIHEWCYFEPYSIEEVAKLLAELHPHFAGLDLDDPLHRDQIELIHELHGGLPGHIVPFIRKLERYQKANPQKITSLYLKTIHLRTVLDRENSIKKSREIFNGKPYKGNNRNTYSSKENRQKEEKTNENRKSKIKQKR